ncbi:MAG TPA: hypothetical protein VFF65_05685, partial [Phycisphaerales bacterium]|nr:hypothetical protein [Phycisphaerales bacterium]
MRYPPGATKAFKKQLMLEAAVHRGVMKKRPCVLTGALAPLGASFFERDWEGRATLELPLVAWRVGGGPVRLAALTAYLHGP